MREKCKKSDTIVEIKKARLPPGLKFVGNGSVSLLPVKNYLPVDISRCQQIPQRVRDAELGE